SLVGTASRLVAARSGAARRYLAASPKLLGARTCLAEPRHGRPVGRGARSSIPAAKCLAACCRFCPALARERAQRTRTRASAQSARLHDGPAGALSAGGGRPPLEHRQGQRRHGAAPGVCRGGPWRPDGKVNLADALVAPDVLRPFLVNWEDVVRYFIRSVEADAAADGTPESAELLDRLLAHKDVREVLNKFPLESGASPVLPMHFRKHDVSLQLFTTIATLGTPQDITAQELRIESFFPMDDESARTLRSWAAKPKSHGA